MPPRSSSLYRIVLYCVDESGDELIKMLVGRGVHGWMVRAVVVVV